jgi:hypothetical protein
MYIEDENKLKIHQIDPPSFTSKNDHTEREYIGVAGALTFDCH